MMLTRKTGAGQAASHARADAPRISLPHEGPLPGGLILVLRRG